MVVTIYPENKLPCPLKRDHFRRNLVFQTIIFRGIFVSFRGRSFFLQLRIYPPGPRMLPRHHRWQHPMVEPRSNLDSPRFTLPETNSEFTPENNHLEKEIPVGNHHVLGAMLNFGGVTARFPLKNHLPTKESRLSRKYLSICRGYNPSHLFTLGHL